MVTLNKIINLYGLVLTGGESRRMKKDKASLEYHGQKQSVVAYKLLNLFCQGASLIWRRRPAENRSVRRVRIESDSTNSTDQPANATHSVAGGKAER